MIAWTHYPNQRMSQILNQVNRLDNFYSSILISGEVGTGKSSLAKYVMNKFCGQGKYIVHDCRKSNLQDLISFLNAVTVLGVIFESIEILSIEAQQELKLFLEEKKGTLKFIFVTSSELRTQVRKGEFSSQLYYSISVLHFIIPSLRERPEDVPLLTQHFLESYRTLYNKNYLQLGANALEKLSKWSWPGNAKELEIVIERAVLLSDSNFIEADHLQFENFKENSETVVLRGQTLYEIEKNYILQTLKRNGNNRTQAAHQLGISVRTLRNKLHEYKQGGENEFHV